MSNGIKPYNRGRVTAQEVDQDIGVDENHNQADNLFDRRSRSSLANWAVLRISLRSFHMPARPELTRVSSGHERKLLITLSTPLILSSVERPTKQIRHALLFGPFP